MVQGSLMRIVKIFCHAVIAVALSLSAVQGADLFALLQQASNSMFGSCVIYTQDIQQVKDLSLAEQNALLLNNPQNMGRFGCERFYVPSVFEQAPATAQSQLTLAWPQQATSKTYGVLAQDNAGVLAQDNVVVLAQPIFQQQNLDFLANNSSVFALLSLRYTLTSAKDPSWSKASSFYATKVLPFIGISHYAQDLQDLTSAIFVTRQGTSLKTLSQSQAVKAVAKHNTKLSASLLPTSSSGSVLPGLGKDRAKLTQDQSSSTTGQSSALKASSNTQSEHVESSISYEQQDSFNGMVMTDTLAYEILDLSSSLHADNLAITGKLYDEVQNFSHDLQVLAQAKKHPFANTTNNAVAQSTDNAGQVQDETSLALGDVSANQQAIQELLEDGAHNLAQAQNVAEHGAQHSAISASAEQKQSTSATTMSSFTASNTTSLEQIEEILAQEKPDEALDYIRDITTKNHSTQTSHNAENIDEEINHVIIKHAQVNTINVLTVQNHNQDVELPITQEKASYHKPINLAQVYNIPMYKSEFKLIDHMQTFRMLNPMYLEPKDNLPKFSSHIKICDKKISQWDQCFSLFYGHNGRLRSITSYEKGLRNGIYQAYYGDGTLRIEKNFKNGLEDGITRQYNSDGFLVAEQSFAKGKLHGKSSSFYIKGQIKDKSYYRDGKLNGSYIEFFANGRVKTKTSYLVDKLQGKFTQYFDNGQIFIQSEYDHGLQDGIYRRFDKNGNILSEVQYKNGHRYGWAFLFGQDQVLLISVKFERDKVVYGRCGLKGRKFTDVELSHFDMYSSLPHCAPAPLPSGSLTPLGYRLK